MKIDRNFTLTQFSDVDRGKLLVAIIQLAEKRQVIHGMKAFLVLGDGSPLERFVTLGPFNADVGDFPTVYDPVALRGPVLDVDEFCHLSPSLEPEYLLPELPLNRNSLGVMFLADEHTLVGAKWLQGPGGWTALFLNLDSGELVDEVPLEKVFATRRWTLIKFSTNGEVVGRHDFTAGRSTP
jgi:hypothetical protein